MMRFEVKETALAVKQWTRTGIAAGSTSSLESKAEAKLDP